MILPFIKKNNNNILGRKTKTPPTPFITPSTSISLKILSPG